MLWSLALISDIQVNQIIGLIDHFFIAFDETPNRSILKKFKKALCQLCPILKVEFPKIEDIRKTFPANNGTHSDEELSGVFLDVFRPPTLEEARAILSKFGLKCSSEDPI